VGSSGNGVSEMGGRAINRKGRKEKLCPFSLPFKQQSIFR